VDKEYEIAPNTAGISSPMLEAASSLAGNLAQSEPVLRLKAAERKLQADQEALKLLADLSELQQKIRKIQYSGAVPESDLTQLRALQNAVGTNETIQDHLLAQELAVAFLRELNQEIRSLLGVDFASLARRSSGCC